MMLPVLNAMIPCCSVETCCMLLFIFEWLLMMNTCNHAVMPCCCYATTMLCCCLMITCWWWICSAAVSNFPRNPFGLCFVYWCHDVTCCHALLQLPNCNAYHAVAGCWIMINDGCCCCYLNNYLVHNNAILLSCLLSNLFGCDWTCMKFVFAGW